jgi:hypothetical protein
MNCFTHNENSALGICKACNKAVCSVCIIDTGNGLACCALCEKEVIEVNQIIAKSKQIYNIGSTATGNAIPTGLLVYIFFTVLFLGWGLFEYLTKSRINEFIIIMGLGFGVMGIIMYRRLKKLNLNC